MTNFPWPHMTPIVSSDPFETLNIYAFKISENVIYIGFLIVFLIVSIRHLVKLAKGNPGDSPPDNRGGTP